MKEICRCQCGTGVYQTPWCRMLCKINGEAIEILHFWYKLEWLRKEVDKRSAYLGKFRRTEESKHLLDLINMTVDENDLFVPFAKAAMADVYDALEKYAPAHEKAYFWNEGTTTIVIDDESGEDSDSSSDTPIYFHAGDYVMYNGKLYIAIEDGNSDDIEGKLLPTEDYRESIHYGLKWCICDSNMNMVEPLDTAIFEALTARIIYKWLCYSYPDEAPRYLMEYEECLEKIRKRVDRMSGEKIVSRIPRIF